MVMSLASKIKNNFKTIGLAGLLALCGGCEELDYQRSHSSDGSEAALLGLGLMGIGVGQNNPGAAMIGNALVNYGAAEAGRSQVNVNVNQPSSNAHNNTSQKEPSSLENARFTDVIVFKWIDSNSNNIYEIEKDKAILNDCNINFPKEHFGFRLVAEGEGRFFYELNYLIKSGNENFSYPSYHRWFNIKKNGLCMPYIYNINFDEADPPLTNGLYDVIAQHYCNGRLVKETPIKLKVEK